MTTRFTLEDTQTLSDNTILMILINDKLEKTHPYVPLRDRLNLIRDKLDKQKNDKDDTLKPYLKWLHYFRDGGRVGDIN